MSVQTTSTAEIDFSQYIHSSLLTLLERSSNKKKEELINNYLHQNNDVDTDDLSLIVSSLTSQKQSSIDGTKHEALIQKLNHLLQNRTSSLSAAF